MALISEALPSFQSGLSPGGRKANAQGSELTIPRLSLDSYSEAPASHVHVKFLAQLIESINAFFSKSGKS